MILSDTERIKQTFREQVTAEAFLAFLKDNGFSVFFRRSAHDCPLAQWIRQLTGVPCGVAHTHVEFYGEKLPHGTVPIMVSMPHSDGRQWMKNFVEQVDSGPYSTIEGWQAVQIMENLLRPYKPFVQPDGLSLLRLLRLKKSKEKVYA